MRAATASARSASRSSPCRRATIACWCVIDPTHEPDGATISSYGSKTSTYRRISGSASRWYPVLTCICPQQVCSIGKTTWCPSRSSTATVALGTSGNRVSARQVANSAIRVTCPTIECTAAGSRGEESGHQPTGDGSPHHLRADHCCRRCLAIPARAAWRLLAHQSPPPARTGCATARGHRDHSSQKRGRRPARLPAELARPGLLRPVSGDRRRRRQQRRHREGRYRTRRCRPCLPASGRGADRCRQPPDASRLGREGLGDVRGRPGGRA